MKICIVDVLKKRNNAVSNLVVGLVEGAKDLDLDATVIKYCEEWPDGRRKLDPSSVPSGTDVLIIPYWISGGIWSINLREIKDKHPFIKIISYSGTSPYWHGSVPGYEPGTRSVNAEDLPADLRRNFEAIDKFTVVRHRPGVNPVCEAEVGVGLQKELRSGPKARRPTVVLDFLKRGWDEASYSSSVAYLTELKKKVPELSITLLNPPPDALMVLGVPGNFVVPHEHLPFPDMCQIMSNAWAFICHNESFGYPIIESLMSGTKVFTSGHAEIPEWHEPWVSPLETLEDWIRIYQGVDNESRSAMFDQIALDYKLCTPWIKPWKEVLSGILLKD